MMPRPQPVDRHHSTEPGALREGEWRRLDDFVARRLGASVAYVTVAAVDQGRAERSLDRRDGGDATGHRRWLWRTIAAFEPEPTDAKLRVRAWGAGGKPRGGITVRLATNDAGSANAAAPVVAPTVPSATVVEAAVPCPGCAAREDRIVSLTTEAAASSREAVALREALDSMRAARESVQADLSATRRHLDDARAAQRKQEARQARVESERDAAYQTIRELKAEMAEMEEVMEQAVAAIHEWCA